MTTDHRENVMKLIEHVREERREIVSDIVERKGRRAVGQKEITSPEAAGVADPAQSGSAR
jgi:hypothetical protein